MVIKFIFETAYSKTGPAWSGGLSLVQIEIGIEIEIVFAVFVDHRLFSNLVAPSTQTAS